MPGLLYFLIGFSSGALVAGVFVVAVRMSPERLRAAKDGAQIAASGFTALAIIAAAWVYTYERQWSPRFSVELRPVVYRVPGADPPHAVVQVAVSITNQGRTSQEVNNIEVGAVALDGGERRQLDMFGDAPSTTVFRFTSNRPKQIDAGETDFAYVEVPVSCRWSLLRLIVKVPQPPFDPAVPPGERRVYQRKALVPLTEACSIDATAPQG